MKKIIYLTLMLVMASTVNIFGQKYDEAKSLKESKFVVVINKEDTAISRIIKNAMKKYWTFCEYKFIDVSENKNYLYQDGYYMLATVSQYGFLSNITEKGEKPPTYYQYSIVTCTPKNKHRDLCYVVGSLMPTIVFDEKYIKLNTYDYLIPYFIFSFNEGLQNVYAGKKDKTHFSADNTLFAEGAEAKIQKMNMLVCKDGVKDEEKAKAAIKKKLKVDASKIKFVSSDEITKATADKTINTTILESCCPVGNFMVYSVSDMEFLAAGSKCNIY
jgi:hypothetical protein